MKNCKYILPIAMMLVSFLALGYEIDVQDNSPYLFKGSALTVDEPLTITDDPYGLSWDGNLTVPTKNAVYDELEAIRSLLPPPPPPVIDSPLTQAGEVGTPLSYQITASNNPDSFDATPLPAGLSVNTLTGLIDGTPTAVANPFQTTISADNAGGQGTAILTFEIDAPASAVLYANGLSGEIYTVDPATGTRTLCNSSGNPPGRGLHFEGSSLWVSQQQAQNGWQLHDGATCVYQGTVVNLNLMTDATIASDGNTYFVNAGSFSRVDGPVANGTFTNKGPVPFGNGNGQSGAVTVNGTTYVTSGTIIYEVLDLTTTPATFGPQLAMTGIAGGFTHIRSMANLNGTVYAHFATGFGGEGVFGTLDPATGVATQIGPTIFDAIGLDVK